MDAQDFLADNIKLATNLLQLKKFVNREEPDVKT